MQTLKFLTVCPFSPLEELFALAAAAAAADTAAGVRISEL